MQQLKVVVEALIGFEEMRDDLDKVDDDPRRTLIGIRAERVLPARLAHVFDVLRGRAHLTLTGTRPDDDVVGHLTATADVKQNDIRALRVGKCACNIDRELSRRLWIGRGA